jgi:small subunit ribosomal protein S9
LSALDKYDVKVTVDGGGQKGQAEAIKLGISRALCNTDAELRVALKPAGFINT